MKSTSDDISGILQGTPRWNAGLEWYDFLLAIAFSPDGTGEMLYGGGQAMRSDIQFRYTITAQQEIHFEFLDTIDPFWMPERGKMFEPTAQNAEKTIAFQVYEGPFVIEAPYHHRPRFRYLLRWRADPFPAGEGPQDDALLDYYGWGLPEDTSDA